MTRFNFKPAAENESLVFGASRPGYPSRSVSPEEVGSWISFMRDEGVQRICCLLPEAQLGYYVEDLLRVYREAFGEKNVCWAPIRDYHLCGDKTLKEQILPFLDQSVASQERVVVHCSGGSGRTGHVLAAWLVHGRQFEIEDALSEVKKMGRNPHEAVECRTATNIQLHSLLHECRAATHQ